MAVQGSGAGQDDQSEPVWRHVGELLTGEHNQINARFDSLESHVAELKTGFSEMKTQMNGLERAFERNTAYNVAQFERLFAFIAKIEAKG